MKVLVTGGAGYIGSQLVKAMALLDQVESILIYDNLSRKNFNLFFNNKLNKVQFVQGDILDSRKLKKIIKDIDTVVHLAAVVSTPNPHSESTLFEQVNHWGTSELVSACESSEVKKIIYLSSASIYGTSDKVADENTLPNPSSLYGYSKLAGEKEIERLKDKSEIRIIRSANVFGLSDAIRFDSVINKFMFSANYFGKITIEGDGTQIRSFVSIDHVVNTIIDYLVDKFTFEYSNLSEITTSLIDFSYQYLRNVYPDLNIYFTNQNIKLGSLKIISKYQELNIKRNTEQINEQLINFKKQFSFS